MLVAFLDPLEQRLADFPRQYLGEHTVLVTNEAGKAPPGLEDAEAVVWWSYPVDEVLISSLPRSRFMQRLGLTRSKGGASRSARGSPRT